MSAHDLTPDDTESIDPTYFTRRATFVPDEESISRDCFKPTLAPAGSEIEDNYATHPVPAEGLSAARNVEGSGHGPDEAQSFSALRSRKRAILAEQSARWDEGRPAPPEQFLRRWPTDPGTDPDAASLLVADYFQRRRRGENPSLNDYEHRFPDQSRSLNSLVSRHHALRNLDDTGPSRGESLRLPDVGDEVFGFRLEHALGKGAFARVFLAGQGHLAGRPVVLKVSAIEGSEPQTLAQLQHTNIVPI
jgi:hypothetical protein